MIKIKFLDNNMFLVKFNGNIAGFDNYINVITSKLIYCAKPNKDKLGGWIFHHSKLQEVLSYFKDVVYDNEYIPPIYFNMGKDMKLQPYEYQKEAIYFALQNREALMVLPCGSGKTPIAIGIYLEAINNSVINSQGLIVVKASLKTQWKKEVEKFSDLNATIIQTYADRCSKWTSKIKKLEKKLKKLDIIKDVEQRKLLIAEIAEQNEAAIESFNAQFDAGDLLIANYETLLDEKVLEKMISKKIECIICDEIHYAKTHSAERSKALYKLNDAIIKIGATATPITKDPRDVYGIYKFVKPELLGAVGKFEKRYVSYAGYGRVNGFKNIDELKDIISDNIFVKTKREIADQLPKLTTWPIYIDLTPEQVIKHDEMMAELEELNTKDFQIRSKCKSEGEAMLNTELQQINGKIMALQTFAQELTDSPYLLSTSDSEYSQSHADGLNFHLNPKLDMCLELIDQILESEEKVCIFSKFERMQRILTEAIDKKYNKKNSNVKIAYINGTLSSDQRYIEAYDKFRDTDEYKILLCSDAGAEGLNLSECKYLIEYDLATSYAIQTQRQGRLERADSIHKNVIVYQLIGNDSWDIIQEKIIKKKEGFDSDIIKSLAKN